MRVYAAKFKFKLLALAVALLPLGVAAASAHAASLSPAVEESLTDAQRREQLNARMAEMLRSGEGARLSEPVVPSVRRPQSRRATPRPRQSAQSSAPQPAAPQPGVAAGIAAIPAGSSLGTAPATSTIAPPAVVARPMRLSTGAFYTPPQLDLTSAFTLPTDPVECLTHAIYYEARNESEDGQAAVAEVVMNRTRSGTYPSSVCAVVYQRNSRTCQFTFTCDGAIGRSAVDLAKWARAESIARRVYGGQSPTLLPATSVNYHAYYVSPSWGRRLERVRQIGAHIFYGAALGGGSTPGAMPSVVEAARPPVSGLVFVRNEGLDRVYQALTAAAATPEPVRQP